MLYVATGDGASYATRRSPRAARAEHRPPRRQDPARRTRPTARASPTTPSTTATLNATRSKVWAYGVRNDFRFNFKPGTNVIFSGDVGWDTWEEINVVTAGRQPRLAVLRGQRSAARLRRVLAVPDPVLRRRRRPLGMYQWDHPPARRRRRRRLHRRERLQLAPYQNTYFFGDYARERDQHAEGRRHQQPRARQRAHLHDGRRRPRRDRDRPDGDIYYLAINAGEIRHIRFVGDNRPPVAVARAAPTAGLAPLTVNFSSAGSNDPDAGQAITYDWNFGDGSAALDAGEPVAPVHHRRQLHRDADRHRSVLPHRTATDVDPGRQHAADRDDHVPGDRRALRHRRHDLLHRQRDATRRTRQHPAVEPGLERRPQSLLRRHVHDCHTHPHYSTTGASGSFADR